MHMPKRMLVAFILDLICWTSLSAWCWIKGYDIAFAIVGAFAIMYLYKCVRTMVRTERALREIDKEFFPDI